MVAKIFKLAQRSLIHRQFKKAQPPAQPNRACCMAHTASDLEFGGVLVLSGYVGEGRKRKKNKPRARDCVLVAYSEY